jgi:hypothetical protein
MAGNSTADWRVWRVRELSPPLATSASARRPSGDDHTVEIPSLIV